VDLRAVCFVRAIAFRLFLSLLHALLF